ncbi:acyl-CoA thioesterase II [Lojkania enalia]|uniref:Acyl-CoA thioesterase II n=1 Tax=Lojkania enalia TaxID=147567 RepID=A0A9P4KEL3_9PLEO|nr:acyl-CoA thioesterase II [Didymosphaeria enalia]
MSTKSRSLTKTLAFKGIGKNEFETAYPPERMGNTANIAYGGYALATAAKAAALSVPQGYHLYSIMGNYLGPALTDRPLRSSVRTIRQTRTFATRQVEVSQKQDDGSIRACLIALADFQVAEPAMLEFSIPPSKAYSGPEGLQALPAHRKHLVDTGKISQQLADMHSKSFGVSEGLYETRPCPEGIFYSNLTGLAKTLPTPQDSLPITEKSTADWLRSLFPLPSLVDNVANLAFVMDGAVSFAPLSFSKMFLDDAGACSSLDFALRLFKRDIKMEEWHLKEWTTKVGAEGRTFSEARLWDKEGNCVACMSQQSILRPKKDGKKGLKL